MPAYLALAVALNVRLVTADRGLATRAQSLVIVDVVWRIHVACVSLLTTIKVHADYDTGEPFGGKSR